MTYCQALELQMLACRGQLAMMRLCWDESGKVSLSPDDKEHLLTVGADGIAATRLLWEAGIRFSFTRPLTEAEVLNAPRGWNPAKRETGKAAV